MTSVLSKNRLFLLWATLIGGTIEWYELYLFVHWGHIFTKLFFHDHQTLAVYNVLFIFFVGVLGRPVGAILFGRLGDRRGRKKAFTYSIALMVLPSFLIGTIDWVLPVKGIAMMLILCLLRFIQGMAVGAELPGAMCYLVEMSPLRYRAFFSSFSFVGPHVGVLLSQVESLLFHLYFSEQFVASYGWRISFIFGGIMALIAVICRSRLQESEKFESIKAKKSLSQKPLFDAISKHWRRLTLCFFVSFGMVAGFFMYSIFLGEYLNLFIEIKKSWSFLIGVIIGLSQVVTLPFWGWIADRYSVRKLSIISTFVAAFFSLSLFFVHSLPIVIFMAMLILMCLNMQSALIPYYITQLFPTAIRYTAIALSFTLCDSLIGGGSPWLGGLLVNKIGMQATFSIFIATSSLISWCIFMMNKNIGRLYL